MRFLGEVLGGGAFWLSDLMILILLCLHCRSLKIYQARLYLTSEALQ